MGALPILLLTRMVATAAIVVGALVVAGRAGPFLGAMIATLPISVGPAYLFLALDHDPAFVSVSALASILGNAGTTVFVLAYLGVAGRVGTLAAATLALGAWAATMAAFGLRSWTTGEALALASVVGVAGIAATRAARARAIAVRSAAASWHLAARAGAVMLLVGATILTGQLIGPAAAGSIAFLPIVFVSLILIMQPSAGVAAVSGILAHGLVALIGFTPAFATINLGAVRWGSWPALAAALAICIGWNALLILVRRRQR